MGDMNRRVNRRGTATREAAIEAAIELWAETGWRVTSVAAVAERVGVTDAALLHHFGTKESFLEEVIIELNRRNGVLWESWLDPGGLATLRRLPELARYIERHPEPYKLQLMLQVDNFHPDGPAYKHHVESHRYNHRVFADLIQTGQERGEIRADVDADLVAGQILAFLVGLVLHREHGPEDVDAVAMCEDFADRLVRDLTFE